MEHTNGGPLGPYGLTVRAERGGELVVSRDAEFSFQAGRTLVLRVDLLRECVGVACGDGETCGDGGCRSAAVPPSELTPWAGTPPPLDAATVDACTTERCNGIDDDCDGAVDEGFDVRSDPANCGACGNSCGRAHSRTSCAEGRCRVDGCESPWADCDREASNGCEVDTSSSSRDCGSCGTECEAPTRDCCGGSCGRC
jgi:hypothetical protein